MPDTKPVEISVPVAVGDLHLLDRVDYQDAFSVDTLVAQSPEQWIRAFVEDAPRWFQLPWVSVGKALLGARFGPFFSSPGYVVGWKILYDRPDAFAIGVDSSGGLSARLVALTPPGQAVVATQIRLSTPYARVLWPVIRRGHRFFAPYLLGRAAANGKRP